MNYPRLALSSARSRSTWASISRRIRSNGAMARAREGIIFELSKPLAFFELVGRLAMDFGFGDILNKIEEEFGKGITRWLLMLVGVAVAAGCIGVIWSVLMAPLLAFLGSPQRAQTGWSIALIAFGIGAGISLGSSLIRALADWRWMRTTKAKIDALEAEFDRVETRTRNSMKEAHRLLDDSRKMYGGASKIVTNLVKAARVTVGNAELPTDLRAELDAHIEHMEEQLEQMREKEREYKSRQRPLRPSAEGDDGERTS